MFSDRCQRGVAMVETAVVMLVFLMIVLGTIELGRAVWYYTTLGYAAREGTRFATVNGSASGTLPGPRLTSDVTPLVQARVVAAATGLDLTAANVSVAWAPDNKPGSAVTVTVSKNFVPATPFIGAINMSRASTLVIER